jgi:aldehyde:ferredoxin oxidoreductase
MDGSRLNVEGKGKQVKNAAIGRILSDSMILCTFPSSMYTREMIADVVSAMSIEPRTVAELDEAGERVMCQERLFNMREGLSRKDDTLPARLLHEPKPDGPTKGVVVPLEDLKDSFYKAMGYDPATGNPTDEVLKKFDVEK